MSLKRFRRLSLCFLTIFLWASSAFPAKKDGEILVSAAISLKDAFGEISRLYLKRSGIRVRLNLSSSGLLQRQIEAGAPVDVFASAGMKQMDALETGNFLLSGTRAVFAGNRLVLVCPTGAKLAPHSFEELAGSGISRLAIGNPKTVPAGQYAEQALKNMALWDFLESRLVPAETVRQALDYVAREEVDAGIVYASDVPVARGKAFIAAEAPRGAHDPILYPIAVIKGTDAPLEAGAFIDLVLDGSGQAIMKKYGFLSVREP
ncbi:MAG: molybdate ABC transporter substrate-binding protein [Acidobacteria bacterium]|nr:molybdate ABC transporter substrate-binding protein [Acidobacteriota bacterium]